MGISFLTAIAIVSPQIIIIIIMIEQMGEQFFADQILTAFLTPLSIKNFLK